MFKLFIIMNKMQKLERLLMQLHRTNSFFKLVPTSSRFFTTETTTDSPISRIERQKIAKENQDDIEGTGTTKIGLPSQALGLDTAGKLSGDPPAQSKQNNVETAKPSGLAQAFERHLVPEKPKEEKEASFASLLRHSNLMHLGDPENKIVVGKIIHVVNNDLYIDFGWKFHCVCTKPMKNNSAYVRGAKVRLRIRQLELSTKFLGATKDVTLLEADCTLLGLISTPNRVKESNANLSGFFTAPRTASPGALQ